MHTTVSQSVKLHNNDYILYLQSSSDFYTVDLTVNLTAYLHLLMVTCA